MTPWKLLKLANPIGSVAELLRGARLFLADASS